LAASRVQAQAAAAVACGSRGADFSAAAVHQLAVGQQGNTSPGIPAQKNSLLIRYLIFTVFIILRYMIASS
jgi:hypothetical protein